MAVLRWWCAAVLEVVVRVRSCGGGAWPFLGGVHAVLGVGGPVLWWSACGKREVHLNAILF
eukprot:8736022-Ditylum_brightwellii.AAC.1